MAWSSYPQERPSVDVLKEYEDDLTNEIFETIDHNFDTEREKIEAFAEKNFTPPEESPPRPQAASMIGRFAKNNADAYQNIFLKNPYLSNLKEGKDELEDALTYIGLKALRDGY